MTRTQTTPRLDIISLFPDLLSAFTNSSILGRAQQKGTVEIVVHNLRDWGISKHKQVDDSPYGGGNGMLLRVDVVVPAIRAVQLMDPRPATVILLSPKGKRFTQPLAEQLAMKKRLILVAGHYEGFDERVRSFVDRQISIGDFVLTGGELPALAIVDAISRLVPGVLSPGSVHEESHTIKNSTGDRMLEYPHYTRPESFEGLSVPPILISGNHQQIDEWRKQRASLPQ